MSRGGERTVGKCDEERNGVTEGCTKMFTAILKVHLLQQPSQLLYVFIFILHHTGSVSSVLFHPVIGHMFLCCLARGHTWKLCSNKSILASKCVVFTYLCILTTGLQYWLNQEDAPAFFESFLDIQRGGNSSLIASGEIQTPFELKQHLVLFPFLFLLWHMDYFCLCLYLKFLYFSLFARWFAV